MGNSPTSLIAFLWTNSPFKLLVVNLIFLSKIGNRISLLSSIKQDILLTTAGLTTVPAKMNIFHSSHGIFLIAVFIKLSFEESFV